MSSEPAGSTGPDLRRDGLAFADLSDRAMRTGHVDGEAVLLARHGEEIFAVAAACTHYSGPLGDGLLDGTTVRCPLHHACFDLRTGSALRAPALSPLACWAVERRGGRIYVGEKRPERDPLAADPSVTVGRARPSSVVIIGAGAAGAAAAEMLRRSDYSGAISIVDGEPDSPYDRPNLSKDYLAGHASADWIPLRPAGFYEAHHIEIVRGHARAIDPARHRVELADGRTLDYGTLLMAPGAEPNRLAVPGSDLPHVRLLRSFADCRAIIADLGHVKRAVIVGVGFIGLEVAASLRTRGVEVHVVAPDAIPLATVMGREIGQMIRAVHEAHGVEFHLGRALTRIDAKAVTLDDGTALPADLVVVGIGVTPRVALAEGAGLTVDRGIVVDEYLATSAADVFAAGDVARWPDRRTGQGIRVEHWVVAERQGQTAVRNMLGAREKFESAPFFWSAHYDVVISYVGHAERWEATYVVGDLSAHDASVRFCAGGGGGGRSLAVASIGQDRKNLEAEVALERDDEVALGRIVPAGSA